MFSKVNAVELFDLLTKGEEYEKNSALITTSVVNRNITLVEAVDERLDVVFDEVFSSNDYLSKNRELLEKTLRQVGSSWREKLEKS